MRAKSLLELVLCYVMSSCSGSETPGWVLDEQARGIVRDEELVRRIGMALDAAAEAGTDPSLSHFHVRAATVVEHRGEERVIVGGNTEYHLPEAIHGETSLLNHVTTLLGPEATREEVRFIAFYAEQCGNSLGCGDCRDYEMATTDYENLLIVCGQASDHTVRVSRFTEATVPETEFPVVSAEEIPLDAEVLAGLVADAERARRGGLTLIDASHHTGAAAVSYRGATYRAAGADDAAFHYRYPIGGVLQQAATEEDYLIRAIVVAGEPGSWPKVSYRDRQYGYESSSFNRRRGRQPIRLILTDGQGTYRLTTFEEALPHAFSTDAFMPEAVDRFLDAHGAVLPR